MDADCSFGLPAVAEILGLPIRTVRRYHDLDVVVPSEITSTGEAEYRAQDVDRLAFAAMITPICRSLVELRALLVVHDAVADECRDGAVRPPSPDSGGARVIDALSGAGVAPEAAAADDQWAERMVDVGAVLAHHGRERWATQWWRGAAALGHSGAMFRLGSHHLARGDLTPSARWFAAASDLLHLDAMSNLAAIHARRNDPVRAERGWRRAADLGHPPSMFNLGVLLHKRGSDDEAERWYLRAADADHAGAMSNLGILAEGRADLDEAERWYRQAAERSHAAAMANLGVLLHRRGALDDAESWYRRAAAHNEAAAMANLAVLLRARGHIAEADDWTARARDAHNETGAA